MSSEPQGQPEEIQKEDVNDNAENEKLLKKILEDNEEKEPFSLRSFIQVSLSSYKKKNVWGGGLPELRPSKCLKGPHI